MKEIDVNSACFWKSCPKLIIKLYLNIEFFLKWKILILVSLDIVWAGHNLIILKGKFGSLGLARQNVSQVEQQEEWNTDCLMNI